MLARPDTDDGAVAEKVAFLSRAGAYPGHGGTVGVRETHMSWVFFVGERVYKLKKPVRFSYLDFSTLAHREIACRAEYALNRALARDVYLSVVPLVRREGRLALGGDGQVVDWLICMRRLDESRSLEALALTGAVTAAELDQVAALLARFYRHARRARLRPEAQLLGWRAAIEENGAVLLQPQLGLPAGQVRAVLAVQRRFLRIRHGLLAGRLRARAIVDAHGDLRPEHVWIGPPVRIIDRLEFSARLRAQDPVEELGFLRLELERLGAPRAGARIVRRSGWALNLRPAAELVLFYRCYRATLRARLAIAHLLDPAPRTPAKWRPQARAYLDLALAAGLELGVRLRRPEGR